MTERQTDPKIVEQQEHQHAERIAQQCDGVCNGKVRAGVAAGTWRMLLRSRYGFKHNPDYGVASWLSGATTA
jgi:hypothetical protein